MPSIDYINEVDELSDEAKALHEAGVTPVKCYKLGHSTYLKVNTRHEIDVCNQLVHWYLSARFGRTFTSVHIGDYTRGYLTYRF